MKTDKIDRNTFRYIEKCLYNYPFNVKRIKLLSNDLEYLKISSDVKAQQYHNAIGGGGHTDPVFAYVAKLEKKESELKQVEQVTAPITVLIEVLENAMKNGSEYNKMLLKVLQSFYFDKLSNYVLCDELSLCRQSRYKKRCELVRLAAAFLPV